MKIVRCIPLTEANCRTLDDVGCMKKIKIDKDDQYRVLLTDVLPYETPLFFSNEGFYKYCRSASNGAPEFLKSILGGGGGAKPIPAVKRLMTIPYKYDIRKGTLGARTISVIHPAVQLRIVELYAEFSHVLLHLCHRSNFSLRYPDSVASLFYGKETPDTPERSGSGF